MLYTQRNAATAVLIGALALYVSPAVLTTISVPFGGLAGDGAVGQFFLSLIASPTGVGSMVQKLILPITAGITVAVLWSRGRVAVAMLATVGAGFVSALFLILYLDIPDVAKDLWQPADFATVQSSKQFATLKDQYLSGLMESLATYILVLLGLQTRARPEREET